MRTRSVLAGVVLLLLTLHVPDIAVSNNLPPNAMLWALASFGSGTDVGAATAPVYAVVDGDLDHDGDRDLVVGTASGDIAIWINDGTPFDNLWASVVAGNCGDAVYALALGDLDHDGHPDLVTGCGGAAAFEVMAWRNDGTPFTGGWTGNGLGGAGPTRAVALGDLDNDGRLDVVSGATTAVIDAWRNDGTPFTGLWSTRQIVGNTVSSANALALGDLDRDGDLDLASGDANKLVKVWTNGGTPFSGIWTSNTVGDSKGIVHTLGFGDLDGDGAIEIVSDVEYPNLGDTGVAAWRSDDTPFSGTWSMSMIGTTTADTVNILALGDVDRDGALDVVAGDSAGTITAWGNPPAPFADPWATEKVGTSADSVNALALIDLDDDGDPDITSGSGTAEDFEVIAWENADVPASLGNWIEVTQPYPYYEALAVGVDDMDHDGKRDIAAGTDGKGMMVWQGDGGYTWAQVGTGELPDADVRTSTAWGQLNNRNEVDLVAASKGAGLGAWVAWEQGTVWDDISTGLPNTGAYEAVALGHIDYDGKLDLAACGIDVGVGTWQGTGTGWNVKSVVSDTLDFCDVALGDVDHNGALDLVAANCGNDAGILFWPGDGGFGYGKVYPVVDKGWYASLALGDIDGDGNPDVAAASGDGGVGIFLGDGAGGWADRGVVGPELTVLSVDLGDFNGDGHLDLLAGHKEGIQIWQGDGSLVWQDASLNLPTTGVYSDVVFGRIDGDAALDIVAAESGASGVRVWTAIEPPPGGWADFEPVEGSWTRDQQPTCTVQVADAGSGLDVSTAQYRFSRDGGSTWVGGWLTAAVSGADGTTDPQVMTAADVAFNQDSTTQNVIQFRITDLEGYTGTSPLYAVAIDVTPPTNPTTLSSASHTPGVWSATATVAATWSGAHDATSGLWGYSYSLTTSATGVPDETSDTSGSSGTRSATADGQGWYFHVRAQDRAGNWATGATHAGPYWIDITNPSAPSSLSSSSHTASVWNDDPTIAVAWAAATDGSGSGIAGYWYSWTHYQQDDPTTYNTTLRSVTSASLASDNDWYFNLQVRDNVDRRSTTLHLGPFYIDTQDPYSDVNAPWPTSLNADFTVSWSSWETEDYPQSGVASVDIGYRDMTGDRTWHTWLTGQAPIDSGTFHGTDGHTYEFRSRATDIAGNTAPWPATAQATTVVTSLDIEAFALEVNQSVQDLANSVDLVTDKRTYVRFHVRSLAHGDQGPLGAQLRAWRGGTYLGLIPPNNSGGTITVMADPDRGDLDESFYFDVPTSWLHGTVQFTADVNLAHQLAEYDYSNNDTSVTVTFHDTPTMDVKLVDACYKTGGTTYHVRDVDRIALADYLRRAYPISHLDVRWAIRTPCYTYRPEAWEVNCSLDWDHWWAWVFSGEDWHSRWYGTIDDGGGFSRGLGHTPGNTASGPAGSDDWDWDYDGSYADWYGAHELGHTYNRPHTLCSGEGDPVVMYPGGDISPTHDEDALYGFDTGTRTIYPPSSKDLMTYCDPLWLSDRTYEGIRNRMVSESGLAESAGVADVGEYLVVFGAVISPTDRITLTTFYRMENSWDAFGRVPGEYSIRLLGSGGTTLANYPFTPSFEWPDDADTSPANVGAAGKMVGTISESVPWVTGTARIAILHGAQELASRAVTAHAPAVTLTSPNGGESFTGATIPVNWTASDVDGDAPVFTLAYSTDGGSRWLVLGSGLTESSITLDADLVDGTTQGKFRIVASDGVNTGQDETNGVFSVPNKTPDVRITSPAAGATYTFGQSVALVADARDLEGGTLTGASLTWTSSLSGTVGTGEMLHVTDLITGTHTITVTANDGTGGTSTDTVAVYVGLVPNRTYLPLILKHQ